MTRNIKRLISKITKLKKRPTEKEITNFFEAMKVIHQIEEQVPAQLEELPLNFLKNRKEKEGT